MMLWYVCLVLHPTRNKAASTDSPTAVWRDRWGREEKMIDITYIFLVKDARRIKKGETGRIINNENNLCFHHAVLLY